MALTNCPECKLQVSNKAISCPHCGYPLREDDSHSKSRKAIKRRMRLPNGFGQISLIKNRNLRKPYRAMVSIGTNEETGRPIVKPLKPNAYFESYNDAYAALVKYNRNPYDLSESITMQELYERWSAHHLEKLSDSYIKNVNTSWNYASNIKNMKLTEVRVRHLKNVINDVPHDSFKTRLKSVLNMMYKYAIEYEIIDKNYASMFSLDKSVQQNMRKQKDAHVSFNKKELDLLWSNINEKWCSLILIQCYMGWRPGELCEIKLNNVDLEKWAIRGGIKTSAGIDRIVPIHDKIKGFVLEKYNEAISLESNYLFNCTDSLKNGNIELTYDKYRARFNNTLKKIGIVKEHKPHDPRKTFVTMLKKGKADEYAIKLMVGHEIKDITESIYTERGIDFLKEELDKADENIK